MMTSAKEVLECLEAGRFEGLIDMVENAWLEAKQVPYVFDSQRAKLELAKDVSALANGSGGILLLGFSTTRKPDRLGDFIEDVRPFPFSMVNADQYRKRLEEWVYPPLDIVDFHVFPSGTDRQGGVAAIVVEEAFTLPGKPYLVTKMLDENDSVLGAQFGFFERKLDRVPTPSAGRLSATSSRRTILRCHRRTSQRFEEAAL